MRNLSLVLLTVFVLLAGPVAAQETIVVTDQQMRPGYRVNSGYWNSQAGRNRPEDLVTYIRECATTWVTQFATPVEGDITPSLLCTIEGALVEQPSGGFVSVSLAQLKGVYVYGSRVIIIMKLARVYSGGEVTQPFWNSSGAAWGESPDTWAVQVPVQVRVAKNRTQTGAIKIGGGERSLRHAIDNFFNNLPVPVIPPPGQIVTQIPARQTTTTTNGTTTVDSAVNGELNPRVEGNTLYYSYIEGGVTAKMYEYRSNRVGRGLGQRSDRHHREELKVSNIYHGPMWVKITHISTGKLLWEGTVPGN